MSLVDDMIENGKKYSLSQGEFFQESEIYCPYCGHINSDSYECLPDHQEEWCTISCDSCEKDFRCEFEIVYNTKTMEKYNAEKVF